MEIIFLFLIGVLIAYRMYLVGKEIVKLLMDPKFYLACIFLYLYVVIGFFLINLPFEIFYSFYSDFLMIIAAILSINILVVLCYVYYKLICKYPILKYPLYFMLLIISFGAIALKIYNMTNMDDNHSEFVNPHNVNDYKRADGTHVKGYWRDGDGNPDINLGKDQGGGYFRRK